MARAIAGDVDLTVAPMMAGEDFSYMLEQRPGAYIFVGNGDTAQLHHPAYDFNDDILPRLAENGIQMVFATPAMISR